MKRLIGGMLLAGALLALAVPPNADAGEAVPAPGKVTMADLGSTTCIPCKMMEPVLAALKKQYAGQAAVIFIDINKDRAAARKFGLRAIPTQIFFDKDGKERWRHEGFLDQKSAAAKLDALLNK